MTPANQDALLRNTYAAVGDPTLWEEVVASWAQAMNADAALLFTPGQAFNSMPMLGHHIDFETAKDYGDYYFLHDVWRLDAQKKGLFVPGTAVLGQAAIEQNALRKSLFYNDFLRKMGQEWLMGSVLFPEGNRLNLPETVLSLYRRPGRRAFGRGAIHAFQRCVPHLQRSLKLHHELLNAQTERGLFQSGMDQLAVGVVLFARGGRVQYANSRAQALLRPPPPSAKAHTPVLDALQALDRQAQCGHYTGLRLQTGHGPLYAWATPNNRLTVGDHQTIGQGSVVWLIDQQSTRAGPIPIAASLFGMSAAEQKVLGLLMQDLAPKQVAQQLGVELSTVRSQLSSLLQKTGVRRQQELLRLMASFPTV